MFLVRFLLHKIESFTQVLLDINKASETWTPCQDGELLQTTSQIFQTKPILPSKYVQQRISSLFPALRTNHQITWRPNQDLSRNHADGQVQSSITYWYISRAKTVGTRESCQRSQTRSLWDWLWYGVCQVRSSGRLLAGFPSGSWRPVGRKGGEI